MAITRAGNTNAQNQLLFGDPLQRKKWFKQSMIEAGKNNTWNQFASKSFDGVVFHKTGLAKSNEGNHIIFDFDGYMTQAPLKGKTNLEGTGVNYKKYSCQFQTRFYHHTAELEGHWDLQSIGSLDLMSQSKAKRQLFGMRSRDVSQCLFDVALGFNKESTPTHYILPNGKTDIANLGVADVFNLDYLEKIAHLSEIGGVMDIGGYRPGIKGWEQLTEDGYRESTIIMLVDYWALQSLDADPAWRALHKMNYRGKRNPLLSGAIDGHKNIKFVYSNSFKGATLDREYNSSIVERAGMRTIQKDNMLWTGEDGWDMTKPQIGSAVILGAGAMISHSEMAPKPVTAISANHEQYNELAIHYYNYTQRTRLSEHKGDYIMDNKAGFDLGLINCHFYVGDISKYKG